ncbi:hypothetical protein [Halegenticoccus soli]|uniref:hypothetical protein n=1 Tax=Halegenticoccus soli TaxID=1985678 RepID=UPI001304679C|nr:hypothetical protein [Halegenticoccus soli]
MGNVRPLRGDISESSAEYVIVRRRDLAHFALEAAVAGAFVGYTAAKLFEP